MSRNPTINFPLNQDDVGDIVRASLDEIVAQPVASYGARTTAYHQLHSLLSHTRLMDLPELQERLDKLTFADAELVARSLGHEEGEDVRRDFRDWTPARVSDHSKVVHRCANILTDRSKRLAPMYRGNGPQGLIHELDSQLERLQQMGVHQWDRATLENFNEHLQVYNAVQSNITANALLLKVTDTIYNTLHEKHREEAKLQTDKNKKRPWTRALSDLRLASDLMHISARPLSPDVASAIQKRVDSLVLGVNEVNRNEVRKIFMKSLAIGAESSEGFFRASKLEDLKSYLDEQEEEFSKLKDTLEDTWKKTIGKDYDWAKIKVCRVWDECKCYADQLFLLCCVLIQVLFFIRSTNAALEFRHPYINSLPSLASRTVLSRRYAEVTPETSTSLCRRTKVPPPPTTAADRLNSLRVLDISLRPSVSFQPSLCLPVSRELSIHALVSMLTTSSGPVQYMSQQYEKDE
ncbi:hypothetical protein C343_02051 [Cryptococcus neoformans C23]|uniref:Uncharacterized protein n=1 Tax=Cryptococcus neoformans (strain H99 / ATCC 208821 / CBS 10515 / FGSC 9487) TaxID=235443 RepID=J9VHT3_CRYN9|nr:hypothetical protein CNAG_02707 [Cryptococcus neoformans var. grubii H99]AUB23578.1 hypothetical protein CKF44_02707 [Cryptococcus neoformans var. grubii]OWZ33916.1 hypothetical protein C347_02119 [Cryptococcus neoformans var. grubii AD2-60a]OWZ46044.1 hypothetical protein C343_02051 [Cryptococcus neoformans var. grubii C23]OXG37017.1 hypothetical protein C360_02141 [Cryptococcus neoformans var. grubii Bt15]AFR93982.2 hypothetical protein CNAG_02707 [Cryptococcus neoformans var. grubii H99]|eukprot:XP_012047930.1 hypothetical protein CNAG_02707 [Cryptococcus neoformans var. grubii H99]